MERTVSESSYPAPAAGAGVGVSTVILLALLMLLPIALSFFFFSEQSLRLDEAQSLWQTSRSPGEILTVIGRDVHVPFYHLSLHFWRFAFGDSVEVARLFSLLFYLLQIPAIYALGALAYSRQVGLFAALLLAISPFMNWYGNEIRMYTLFTFLVIINQYCFLRIYKRRGTEPWAGYALSAIAGVFTHYFFFLPLVAQGAFYLLRRASFPPGSLRRLLISWALVVVAFAPWAWFVYSLGEVMNQQPLLEQPTAVNLFGAFAQFLFGFQEDHLNTVVLSLWPVILLLGFLALRRSGPLQRESEYFLLTVLLSVAIAFAASFVLRPVFVSRYLIFTIPSLYLLLAALLNLYSRPLGRGLAAGLVALMLFTLSLEIVNPATPVKEQYREAALYLDENARPQDVVVVTTPFTVYPMEYYYRGVAPLTTYPHWNRLVQGAVPPFTPDTLEEDIEALASDHQRLFILMSYDQGYEEELRIHLDTNYERLMHREFSPKLNLYVYKLRYDTPLSRAESGLP